MEKQIPNIKSLILIELVKKYLGNKNYSDYRIGKTYKIDQRFEQHGIQLSFKGGGFPEDKVVYDKHGNFILRSSSGIAVEETEQWFINNTDINGNTGGDKPDNRAPQNYLYVVKESLVKK